MHFFTFNTVLKTLKNFKLLSNINEVRTYSLKMIC